MIKRIALLLTMLVCMTSCSFLQGEEVVVENLCKDSAAACATALLICESPEERGRLARSSSDTIAKGAIQCSRVREVCDSIMLVCAQQK